MTKHIQELLTRLRGTGVEAERDETLERLSRMAAAEARRKVRITPLTER